MANCTDQPIGIGRGLVVSWVSGCGIDDPLSTATTPLVYKKLGFVETRGENFTPRTVTSNTDSFTPIQLLSVMILRFLYLF